jgi:hypothetical protein
VTDLDTFRQAAIAWAVRGDDEARAVATSLSPGILSVVLVEGVSDAAAVETLVDRTGRNRERVCVIPMGGLTNIAHFLRTLGPEGLDIRVAGLCDVNEEPYLRRALIAAGFGQLESADDLSRVGFFVCVVDLEDELIRALGASRVQEVLDEQGDLRAFRVFQNQPAQRERSLERQLRRFLGTTAGRKEQYGTALVAGLDVHRVPAPLRDLVEFAF